MTDKSDRVTELEKNYSQALINEPQDLSEATDTGMVTAIQINVATAGQAYWTAVKDALNKSGQAVEDAYQAARAANEAVARARANSERLPTLLGKLKTATDAATKLLNAAKNP